MPNPLISKTGLVSVFPKKGKKPDRCESKGVIWVGQITQTQHLSKDYRKSEWWCASAVPEGKLLMGKGMLLHQMDDADADRGHS